MKNILLLNGAKEFGNSKGQLNLTLHKSCFRNFKNTRIRGRSNSHRSRI